MYEWGLLGVTFLVTLLITPLVAWLMRRLRVLDRPQTEARKIHHKPIPLGGGLAIYVVFFATLFILLATNSAMRAHISWSAVLGLWGGATILMVGGFWDDKYRLRARHQIWFPILAAVVAVVVGIGPEFITNPWGGVIELGLIAANAITFVWLMGMMFTTKFLDGVDGLVAGVVAIGALVLYALTNQPQWYQPELGLVAMILAGACLGFLVWNFHPAKIFLGEGGSLLTGFLIGVLAIIAGGKIMTTFLVMGLPALDVGRVIIRRWQKHRPVFMGDREHLHYQLIGAGLTQRQTVLLLYGIAILFGVSGLVLQNVQKIVALAVLLVLMVLVSVWLARRDHRKV